MANYTRLENATTSFSSMLQRFGVVTVMNVKVYDSIIDDNTKNKSPKEIYNSLASENALCTIDTLKIANITVDGPSKTVTGGQYSNPLIKFGKSARLEMQDALGDVKAIEALCGGIGEYSDAAFNTPVALHYGEDFGGPKTIVGESFFIDQSTGAQVPVTIIFYQFLPDSIFNLTQDAEGDATVFDMNGDLMTTVVTLPGQKDNDTVQHGIFYSILSPSDLVEYIKVTSSEENLVITKTNSVTGSMTVKVDGVVLSESNQTVTPGTAVKVVVNDGSKDIYTRVISN